MFAKYFDRGTLATDPKQRFTQLFQVKKRWLQTELLPYISDLIVGTTVDALLSKFTRTIQNLSGGEKAYSAKL